MKRYTIKQETKQPNKVFRPHKVYVARQGKRIIGTFPDYDSAVIRVKTYSHNWPLA